MNAITPPVAEGVKDSAENISVEELLVLRSGGNPTEREAIEESEPIDPVEETQTEPQSESEIEDAEIVDDDSDEVIEEEGQPNDIDLASLTVEQIQELTRKHKSRLLQRVGELTAKNKALEDKLNSTSAKLVQEIPQEANPFRDLQSIEEIQAKYKELEETLDLTDQILDEHEDYAADDIIQVGNKEFTKKDIRKANKDAKAAITKYLPAQHAQVAKLSQIKELGGQYVELAKKEVPEIQDNESQIGKKYNEFLSDPLIDKLRKDIPELGMQIEYILAHASRSIFGNKAKDIPIGAGTKLKAKPPSSPVSSNAGKPAASNKSIEQSAKLQFEKSGRPEDLIAWRIAQQKK